MLCFLRMIAVAETSELSVGSKRERFAPVDEPIHHKRKQACRKYIKGRVLLDEHGRKNDGEHHNKGYHLDRAAVLEFPAFTYCQMNSERVVNVDTWKQVCRSIDRVQKLAEHGAEIVVCKVNRT